MDRVTAVSNPAFGADPPIGAVLSRRASVALPCRSPRTESQGMGSTDPDGYYVSISALAAA